MLVTKFNVKLNQLFILLMREEFYSDQIYFIRYDSSKACLFIGPQVIINNNIYLKSNIQCTYRYEFSGLYNNNIQLQ